MSETTKPNKQTKGTNLIVVPFAMLTATEKKAAASYAEEGVNAEASTYTVNATRRGVVSIFDAVMDEPALASRKDPASRKDYSYLGNDLVAVWME